MAAVRSADPSARALVAAIDEPTTMRPYGPEVRWRISQEDPESYLEAARSINASKVDVVNIQHEFGLYGVWREVGGESRYEDHLRPFLREIRKPVVTTLHSVPPSPSPSMRAAIRSIAELSDEVVVMAEAAVGLMAEDYGVWVPPTVIPHGMPAIEPHGRARMKAKLGVEGRTLISTFGLVDPRKGLEYMVRAMPAVLAQHPDALYLIAGQTHPDLLRSRGEEYRNSLVAEVESMGLRGHVSFLDQYMVQRDIIDLLLATDVYVTPYLDPRQITSGTLAYALGAGKAIVSTSYLHASEALADDRGLLVDFHDSAQLAAGVNEILGSPDRKRALEAASFAYAKKMTWPHVGRRSLELMQHLEAAGGRQTAPSADGSPASDMAHRLLENPLLTAADVGPSQPELEVVSVFNAAAARVGEEVVLLLRVAEQPRRLTSQPEGAQMLDLSGPQLRLLPLPAGIPPADLIGAAFLNTQLNPPAISVGYLPRDLPGLELDDPRMIRYHTKMGGSSDADTSRDYLTQISHLRVARSRDGVRFEVDPHPALSPSDSVEEYGCEDARATLIDGVWHITYVSVAHFGITTSLATTSDFRSFERKGVIFLPDHKDVTIFPERVGGRYVALTRPMPQSFDRVLGIWIAFSTDLLNWGGHRPLALPRWGCWDEVRTGASAVPFRVPEGWLEIYHGVDRNTRYALGAVLLDAEDPSRVIGRSSSPILEPTEPYETSGLFNDTVFSCGHVALDDRGERIRVYYGAADSCLAAADFGVREIIDHLTPC